MIFLKPPTDDLVDVVEYEKLLKYTITPAHKLLFAMCWELGESFSLLLRLRTHDCYLDPLAHIPSDVLLLPTRGKPYRMREFTCSRRLDDEIRAYDPPDRFWLFPSLSRPGERLSVRAAARALDRAAARAGIRKPISPRILKRSALAHWKGEGVSIEELVDRSGLSIEAVRRNLEKSMAKVSNSSRI